MPVHPVNRGGRPAGGGGTPGRALALALPGALLLSGCGATTFRLGVGPAIDSAGKAGVEATASIGIGTPLDFHGRSHHFLQALGVVGGGLEPRSRKAEVVLASDVDYIYWAEPRMDIRFGMRLAHRAVPSDPASPSLYGFGGHVGILPIVWGSDSSWLVTHFFVGGEAHVEYLWSDPAGASRGLFSFPVVTGVNLLGAGD